MGRFWKSGSTVYWLSLTYLRVKCMASSGAIRYYLSTRYSAAYPEGVTEREISRDRALELIEAALKNG